jgi:hypothetical protein
MTLQQLDEALRRTIAKMTPAEKAFILCSISMQDLGRADMALRYPSAEHPKSEWLRRHSLRFYQGSSSVFTHNNN